MKYESDFVSYYILQVEHGVTELCYGVDLVAWMVCLAYGCLEEFLGMSLKAWTPNPQGHAIQVRIYAEDPVRNFQPSPGVITSLEIPVETGTRVDTGVYRGMYTHHTDHSLPPKEPPEHSIILENICYSSVAMVVQTVAHTTQTLLN